MTILTALPSVKQTISISQERGKTKTKNHNYYKIKETQTHTTTKTQRTNIFEEHSTHTNMENTNHVRRLNYGNINDRHGNNKRNSILKNYNNSWKKKPSRTGNHHMLVFKQNKQTTTQTKQTR